MSKNDFRAKCFYSLYFLSETQKLKNLNAGALKNNIKTIKYLFKMDGQSNATLIRKLRKKLRQIENLTRTDRDLSAEEQEKVRVLFILDFLRLISKILFYGTFSIAFQTFYFFFYYAIKKHII